MKKVFAYILALTLIIAFAAGCTGNVNNVPGDALRPTEEPISIKGDKDLIDLRVNYEKDAECVDGEPVFSWTYNTTKRSVFQKNYRIRVALSAEALDNGELFWDSGEVESSDFYGIKYTGTKELTEAAKYYWDVIVTTTAGDRLCSDASTFTTALFKTGFEGAYWVTDRSASARIDQGNWIWYLKGDTQGTVPVKTEYFKKIITVDKDIKTAVAVYTADDYGELYVNGVKVITITKESGWQNAIQVNVTEQLKKGENLLAARCVNNEVGYGAILFVLNIEYTDGSKETVVSDKSWVVSDKNQSSGWEKSTDTKGFSKANSMTAYGEHPWFSNSAVRSTGNSAPIVRGEFDVNGKVRSAILFASAAGLYDAYVNGSKVDESALNPGRSEYPVRVMYQSYDVTALLNEGKNVLGAMLGRGWYIGAYSPYGGTNPAFICKLVIDYEDGRREYFTTDENWDFTSEGPILYDDIFDGETYDARKEISDWSKPSCSYTGFEKVAVTDEKALKIGELVPQLSGKVTTKKVLQAQTVTKIAKDTYIYDFGQNLAGVPSVKLKGKAGTEVTFRHAEMLNDGSAGSDGKTGTLYTANLRSAKATDTYTLKGSSDGEIYTPTFTFHGFRYLEIKGISSELPLEDVKALVLYSDLEDTGSIETSDELINKLYLNTLWGQRGNFLSTPTDCPQRDERMGWSGDAQIFCGTAAYNMNVKSFFDKYITDLNDCQHSDGSYPDVAPETGRANYGGSGNNAWGDAGVIIPWIMYERYGDLSYIEKYYDNMTKYSKYLVKTSNNYIRERSAYGDWLAVESTPVGVTDTAYCVRVFDLLSKMAELLGRSDDAASFKETANKYRDAWVDKYVRSKDRLKSDTQTAYLVGLAFDIIPDEYKASMAERLNTKIQKSGALTTGFIGCNLLLPVLCEYGYTETAFMLLQNEEYPSWKYPILQGATTIWERWNSYTIENGFGDAGMNSFNHYSYGSVTEWLYNTLTGINPGEPGETFRHFVLKPTAGGGITFAKGVYNSIAGLIKSSWTAENEIIKEYSCTVPGNTTATLYLKADSLESVKEGGKPVNEIADIKVISTADGVLVLELGSGEYNFTIGG